VLALISTLVGSVNKKYSTFLLAFGLRISNEYIGSWTKNLKLWLRWLNKN